MDNRIAYVGRMQIGLRLIQLMIFTGVVLAATWFQEAHDYPINPALMAVWGFVAAYGFTLAYDWLLRRGD